MYTKATTAELLIIKQQQQSRIFLHSVSDFIVQSFEFSCFQVRRAASLREGRAPTSRSTGAG